MPEIIQIAGLEDGVGQEPAAKGSDLVKALTVLAVIGGAVLVLGIGLPKLLGGRREDSALGDLGIIQRCRARDMKKGRPKRSQQWCLWDSKGKRILGRHPSRKRAVRQERLIQVRKHGG